MRPEDQDAGNQRYAVIPRTLTFLTHGDDVLLLRGAPNKRLWANRLNGVGGHVKPGEDILTAAIREVREETGLAVSALHLRALVHIDGRSDRGVLLFVYTGLAPCRRVRPNGEGTLAWYDRDALPMSDLVEDLTELLPRVLCAEAWDIPIYGHYAPGPDGRYVFRFR